MTEAAPTTALARLPRARHRVLVIAVLIAGLVLVASSAELHAWLMKLLPKAEAIITARPVLGGSIFVLFAALAAMLAFVSSAVIVPVGIYVWGTTVIFVLLWVGWILGGACAYTIGRHLGRPVVNSLTSEATLAHYEHAISHRAPFHLVLLFQLALPSEVPGYLLGLVRYRFWKYLAALALAELPYAVATVHLGAGFIERRTYVLVGVGAAVAIHRAGPVHAAPADVGEADASAGRFLSAIPASAAATPVASVAVKVVVGLHLLAVHFSQPADALRTTP